jgi:trimeric autotransporter adhesin
VAGNGSGIPTTTGVTTSNGGNSIAIGTAAQSLGNSAVAVGPSATATGANAFAGGIAANASGASAVAIGQGAVASGDPSTALGAGSMATGNNSTAIGATALASGAGAFAGGFAANAGGVNAVAIGNGASAAFVNSSALGNGATTTRANQVAIGTATNTYTTPGITTNASIDAQAGPLSVVTTDAAGNLAQIQIADLAPPTIQSPCTELFAGALNCGANSQASGTQSTAIGQTATATGLGSTAIGFGSVASGTGSTAQGQNSVASGNQSTAIGAGASATAPNSVALGAGSIASSPNTLSVGSPGSQRRITNVAPGIAPTDAVNVSQLNSSVGQLNANLNNGLTRAYEGSAIAMALSGGFLPDNKRYAIAVNWGGYHGTSAFGAIGLFRISDNLVIDGGVGVGVTRGDVGGRVGLTYAW